MKGGVWHFTSVEAMDSIIESGRISRKERLDSRWENSASAELYEDGVSVFDCTDTSDPYLAGDVLHRQNVRSVISGSRGLPTRRPHCFGVAIKLDLEVLRGHWISATDLRREVKREKIGKRILFGIEGAISRPVLTRECAEFYVGDWFWSENEAKLYGPYLVTKLEWHRTKSLTGTLTDSLNEQGRDGAERPG